MSSEYRRFSSVCRGRQDIEIVKGENIIGPRPDDGGAVFEDEFSAEISGDDEQAIPRQADRDVNGERFSSVLIEKKRQAIRRRIPGGDVGHEFMPFDLFWGIPARPAQISA